MALVTMPLGSYSARGKVAGVVFSSWRGKDYVRRLVTPRNPQSDEQMAMRDIVSDASIAWKNEATVGAIEIDTAYKAAYSAAAAGQAYSGFNLFIKDCMSINLVDTVGVKSYDGTLVIATAPGVLA